MKKHLFLGFVAFFMSSVLFAQKEIGNVGIGTKVPDPSSLLDLSSSQKGLLIPRMNQVQRDAISQPATGLMIFQIDKVPGFYFFDGNQWQNLRTSSTLASGSGPAWTEDGNAAGSGAFLGTTNSEPLQFKVNNTRSGFLSNGFQSTTAYGYESALNSTGTGNTAIGYQNLKANTTGSYNTAIGTTVMSQGNGSFNIGIGLDVLSGSGGNINSGNYNIGLGANVLQNNTVGAYNLGIGSLSLNKNTQGSANVGIGTGALQNNTLGGGNFALGSDALYNNQTGGSNIAVGFQSLYSGTNTNNNVAIGPFSGYASSGSSNVFIGYEAGRNETGSNKLYIENTSTSAPLIGGDFFSNKVGINTSMTAIASSPAGVNFMVNGAAVIGNVTATTLTDINTPAGYSLYVANGILTEKVKVSLQAAVWADYVFAKDYKMMSLPQVERFYKANKHLPNVPSAAELEKTGLDMVKTDAKLMEKIEELTIYLVDINKQVQSLKAENNKLKKQISQLKK